MHWWSWMLSVGLTSRLKQRFGTLSLETMQCKGASNRLRTLQTAYDLPLASPCLAPCFSQGVNERLMFEMRAAGKSSPDTLLCPLCPHFFGLPASELYNICSWKRSLGTQNQNMTPRGFEHLRAICKGPRLKVDFFSNRAWILATSACQGDGIE